MINIYLGGPLFTESEQNFNRELAEQIRAEFGELVNVYNPMENEEINDKSGYANSIDIFEGDNLHLDQTDILIANLDGVVIDPGMAAEIGYFYQFNRPIIGLYTDVRQGTHGNQEKIEALDEIAESQFSYTNLYVVGAVKKRGPIATSTDELLYYLKQEIGE